jgi:hypothetical protein
MKKLTFLLFICFYPYIWAQERVVTGVVEDESGTLPGVRVSLKGTAVFTETNFDGEFSITIPDNDAVLVFSFLGYKSKEVRVKKKTHLKVLLDEGGFICSFSNLSLGYSGGLNYTPTGINIDLVNPYFLGLKGAPDINYIYQAGTHNYKHDLKISYSFLSGPSLTVLRTSFVFKDFNIRETSFAFKEYSLQSSFNLYPLFKNYTNLDVGIGYAKKVESQITQNNIGYRLGAATHFSGIKLEASTSYWNHFWQYNAGVHWSFKKIQLSYKYSKIATYNEHSIGIGYLFYY